MSPVETLPVFSQAHREATPFSIQRTRKIQTALYFRLQMTVSRASRSSTTKAERYETCFDPNPQNEYCRPRLWHGPRKPSGKSRVNNGLKILRGNVGAVSGVTVSIPHTRCEAPLFQTLPGAAR